MRQVGKLGISSLGYNNPNGLMMKKGQKTIPIRSLGAENSPGITIARVSAGGMLPPDEEIRQVHRDKYHVFILLEKGTASFEVDFREHLLNAPSLIYIRPYQVHRGISIDGVTFTALLINGESLNAEYRTLLDGIYPAGPLALTEDARSLLTEAASLCIRLYERRNENFYRSILTDSCNAFVGLMVSQYTAHSTSPDALSRFDVVNKAFYGLLELHFLTMKRPADYAALLNISVPYLNECVKSVTDHPVSYHIRQRVLLEAKRLLYHTSKSVKEIGVELGYGDHAYFSRLFAKATGMSALSFRKRYAS